MEKRIIVLFLLWGFIALNVIAAEKTSSSDLGEVEIKGEAKDKVKIKKTLPEMRIYVPDIVDSITEKTEKLLGEGKAVPSEDDFNAVEYQISGQAAKPFLPDIAQAPLITFYPDMAKVPVKRWELVINDDKGNIVDVISGKGNPVKAITWDGKDKKGQMLNVDSLYSYKFIVYDELKNPHTAFGKSFKVDAVIYKTRTGTVIEFHNDYIFGKNSSKFNPDSNLVLARAVDLLRTESKYPFRSEEPA